MARHRTVFLPVIGADGPEAEISPTYLHELGHALGISGHSIYADDLMFYDSRVNKLSNRDRNTMKRLYSNESASLAATLLSEGVRDHQVDALVTEADLCSLRDPQQAHSYYEDAAKQHSIVAYERLGVMFDHGIGVPRDKVKAFQNYKMAAEAGSPEAFYHLGIMYLVHVKTNPADWENARSCFERAADLDFGPAQCELGKMYEYGKAVEKDEAQAATLYELAANNEVPEAQRLLSRMYASGRGVTQDSGKAQYWAKRAQSNGLH